MHVKAATYKDRERLISSILTMRMLALMDIRGPCLDNLKILHNKNLDHSLKIQAYAPIDGDYQANYSNSLTIDYESGLIRKLSELMSSEV